MNACHPSCTAQVLTSMYSGAIADQRNVQGAAWVRPRPRPCGDALQARLEGSRAAAPGVLMPAARPFVRCSWRSRADRVANSRCRSRRPTPCGRGSVLSLTSASRCQRGRRPSSTESPLAGCPSVMTVGGPGSLCCQATLPPSCVSAAATPMCRADVQLTPSAEDDVGPSRAEKHQPLCQACVLGLPVPMKRREV